MCLSLHSGACRAPVSSAARLVNANYNTVSRPRFSHRAARKPKHAPLALTCALLSPSEESPGNPFEGAGAGMRIQGGHGRLGREDVPSRCSALALGNGRAFALVGGLERQPTTRRSRRAHGAQASTLQGMQATRRHGTAAGGAWAGDVWAGHLLLVSAGSPASQRRRRRAARQWGNGNERRGQASGCAGASKLAGFFSRIREFAESPGRGPSRRATVSASEICGLDDYD